MGRPLIARRFRAVWQAMLVATAIAGGGCATSPPSAPDDWRALADAAEQQIAASPDIMRDPALSAHLRGIACRVAPVECASVRIHVIARGGFHASMWPNGALEIGTGTLLRVDDDDELAFVIAHEIAHFRAGDAITTWRQANLPGVLASVRRGSVRERREAMAASRAFESAADRAAVHMLVAAGIDARAAARVYANLCAELACTRAAAVADERATHPALAARAAALRDATAGSSAPGSPVTTVVRALVAPHRAAWLRREAARDRDGRLARLLDRLITRDAGVPHDDLAAARAALAADR